MIALSLGLSFILVSCASGFYGPGDDVVELTPSNFHKTVMDSEHVWFIEFYAPWCGHCQALTPEWKKAASALKGIVKVGAVNADEHQGLGGQYGVKGFPTIKIFEENKYKPRDYQGARTAQGIVDAAVSSVQSTVKARLSGKAGSGDSGDGKSKSSGSGGGDSNAVIELTDSNFDSLVLKSDDMWLVEFYAPWCGHCKNLAPHWASAASELKGKVKLGALDATVHTVMANRYGVRGFPTIKFFPSGKKDDVSDYDGGRTSSDIVRWALDKLSENVPAPEIYQITDSSVLQTACDDHQLCIVSVLPHILDCQAKCRNDYLKVLNKLGDKYKKQGWGWVWAEAGHHLELEENLEIGGFGYPALAAVNSRKMKFSLLRGSFSEAGINEFLRDLSFGKGSTAPLKNAKLPTIGKVEPWDGKDGALPVEDDDVGDVDLDDDKKDEL